MSSWLQVSVGAERGDGVLSATFRATASSNLYLDT